MDVENPYLLHIVTARLCTLRIQIIRAKLRKPVKYVMDVENPYLLYIVTARRCTLRIQIIRAKVRKPVQLCDGCWKPMPPAHCFFAHSAFHH